MRKLRIPSFTSQQITVLVSLLISICALVASTMQVFVMEQQSDIMLEQQKLMLEQYRASVWARVECFVNSQTNPMQLSVVLRNAGTGPALIQGFGVRYAGRPYHQWQELFRRVSPDSTRQDRTELLMARVTDRTLVAGEELVAVSTTDSVLVTKLLDQLDLLQIDVCYQSVYGTTYQYTRRHQQGAAVFATQEVPTCTIPVGDRMR